MFLSRVQLFILTKILNIVLPILILFGLFQFGRGNLIDNIIYIFFVGNFIFLLFKTAPWEFTNYYIRYILVLMYLIIAFRNLIINTDIQDILNTKVFIDVLVLVPSLILMYLNISSVRASKKPEDCINLSLPFKNGKYIITDGGDGKISSLLNYHNKAQIHKNGKSNTSMRYATDISKLNKIGFTVKNVLTKENEDYEIFHEKVYCPCDATIVEIVNGIEENISFNGKYPYNVGNRIILKIDNYYIVMGHLVKDSIIVKVGNRVKLGQQLAIVGNSGLTPRPHLHMQVSKCEDGQCWQGKSIPIFFNELYYPIKNKIIKV
ncbi:M23 family metallopeptidase [Clostridium gasigenes]|uniref:M23 family metallopeptidase n=1 Tax=Clostridium gasigenes TaxID=94869 RepID=A0A7X0VRU7_9CLOT|nr:M23 family metallopeptidase [Clostridium gasigenes]MBB6715020.1 M23 family metallopeptidase [Clostridium gasigenes]